MAVKILKCSGGEKDLYATVLDRKGIKKIASHSGYGCVHVYHALHVPNEVSYCVFLAW